MPELNLVTEEGYFMLDQCRDVRNNFSAAHPTIGPVDGRRNVAMAHRVYCANVSNGKSKPVDLFRRYSTFQTSDRFIAFPGPTG